MDLPKIKFTELQQSKNLTDKFSEQQLRELGSRVHQDYMNDDSTRETWKKNHKDAMELALQVKKAKNYPWRNASNVKFPLLSQAALQFQSRAYSGLVTGTEIVRHHTRGKDDGGLKAARASRISQHMNYQLSEEDDWEGSFDKMLMVLPIMGLCYRKKYWCPKEQRIKTDTVLPQDLVVPYRTKSLDTTPRLTEMIELYDRDIKANQLRKLFREVDLGPAPILEDRDSDERDGISQGASEDRPRLILEQHLYLDLDTDGYTEPYTVTIDESTREVLRIVQRFGKVISQQSEEIDSLTREIAKLRRQGGELLQELPRPDENGDMSDQAVAQAQEIDLQAQQIQQAMGQIQEMIAELKQQSPKILEIKPIHLYTKYSFIPAPDNSFYDIGFGSLLSPLNSSVNALINQLIDSGSLQNGSQGFLGKGARMKGGKINFEPYEWKRVNVMGGTLRESIVPLPVNSPSPVLFNLLGLLIEFTKDLSSVNDAMSGKDLGQNTPAYNMKAMLEQGMQVFSNIFKRVHRGMRQEFRHQYVLNSIYLDDEEYFEVLDGEAKIMQQDYKGDPKDVYPAADSNAFSEQERMVKNQFLAERSMSVPGYDPVQIELRLLQSMEIDNYQEVFPLDEEGKPAIQPPENPEISLKAADQQRKTEESRMRSEKDAAMAEANIQLIEAQVKKIFADIQKGGDELDIKEFDSVTKRLGVLRQNMRDQQDFITSQKEAERGDNEGTTG